MPLDQTANFIRGATAEAVDDTQTTIEVGDASIFPDPAEGEFNVVCWDAERYPRPDQDDDVEILRVTGRDTGTDELTVQRGQEDTDAASHPQGSALHLAPTAKTIEDIEDGKADDPHGNEDHDPAFAEDPHALGGDEHDADTLASLNAKVSDATLDDTNDARTPEIHATSHQDGGGDELNVAGLSGELADPQPTSVEDSATAVADVTTLDFGDNLDVSEDAGTATVDAQATEGDIDLLQVADVDSLPDPENVTSPTIAYIDGEDDYAGVFQE